MAKVEVTVKIDGKVHQLKHEGPLDLQVIGEASNLVVSELMSTMTLEQADELKRQNDAEVEAARLEAEAENKVRSDESE